MIYTITYSGPGEFHIQPLEEIVKNYYDHEWVEEFTPGNTPINIEHNHCSDPLFEKYDRHFVIYSNEKAIYTDFLPYTPDSVVKVIIPKGQRPAASTKYTFSLKKPHAKLLQHKLGKAVREDIEMKLPFDIIAETYLCLNDILDTYITKYSSVYWEINEAQMNLLKQIL